MFYDPEGAIMHQRNIDRERARSNATGERERVTTPADSRIAPEEEKYVPLVPEHWKSYCLELRELNILKMPRVLQTLFYLLRYTREEICERGTNKLDFKKVKQLMNDDLFKRMSEYEPFGQSEEEYKVYQKLKFIK